MYRSRAALIIAALGLAIATAGCGGDSDSGGLDPVARAAEATRSAGTAQVRMKATVEASGQKLPMSGEGVMSTREDGSARLTMDFTARGKRFRMHEIAAKGVIYMGGGPLEKQIPFGKKWMKIDVQKLIEKHGGDMSKFDNGGGNATKVLDYLQGAGEVKKVGRERILGATTTHYHATIDLQQVADEAGDEQVQAFLEQSNGETKTVPSDVWIDAKHRVRRYRMVIPMQAAKMDMTIDFVRFGVVLDAEAPPENEVFDATQLAEKEIQQAGG